LGISQINKYKVVTTAFSGQARSLIGGRNEQKGSFSKEASIAENVERL